MNLQARKVLYIDLENKEFDVKSEQDLLEYIGGVGLGIKLYSENSELDPVIFAIGPLNGFFPYASKTSVLFSSRGKLRDTYLGGSVSTRIKFTGLDAIVLAGEATESMILDITDDTVFFRAASEDVSTVGLPGKRSVVYVDPQKTTVDGYFESPGDDLSAVLNKKGVRGIVITGTKTFEVPDFEKYSQLYASLLERSTELTVEKGGNPSCSGCPMGCERSKIGEVGGDVLVHSLVACEFARPLYSDPSAVFACLNVLGYGYTHEQIENFPRLVYDEVRKQGLE